MQFFVSKVREFLYQLSHSQRPETWLHEVNIMGMKAFSLKLPPILRTRNCYFSSKTNVRTSHLFMNYSYITSDTHSLHPISLMTEVFPCFFLSCKANARGIPRKDGARSALILIREMCCSMYCLCRLCCLCIVCV